MAKNNFDKALTSFISPDNLHLKYENFVSEIINQFLDVEGVPKEEFSHISKSMMDIFDQIKDTRQFNEKYIGHMLSEASIPGMLGFLLAIRLGSNTVAPEVSLYESRLEKYALDGLIDIVGYKKGIASGTFTSGGSMAVLTALRIMNKPGHQKLQLSQQEWLIIVS
jgi:glutamate/tyrosine decarboxylase-like PLP-dependent enzyme